MKGTLHYISTNACGFVREKLAFSLMRIRLFPFFAILDCLNICRASGTRAGNRFALGYDLLYIRIGTFHSLFSLIDSQLD